MIGAWLTLTVIAALGVAAVIILVQPGSYKGRHRSRRSRFLPYDPEYRE